MTKKLQKMIKNPKPKVRKKKEKKLTKKQRLAVRGVTLHVGVRKTIDLMAEHIREQGLSVPTVDLSSKDPASKFSIHMYASIGKWGDNHLAMFIEGVTGDVPKFKDVPSMLGTVRAIFHAIFEEEASREDVIRYDSAWKMWPNVRLKPSKKERRKEMATSKGSTKKASRKKVGAKKTAKNKTTKVDKKKVGKKKADKKKAIKKTGGRLTPITGDTKLLKKKASCGESETWDEFLSHLPKKAVTFDALVAIIEKKMDGDEAYTRRVLGSLRRRDCIVSVD